MPIEGFDYKGFSEELATQAIDLIPKEFQDFQKEYVVNTIKNFSTLSGEAIYNDDQLKFTAEQGMLVTQIIAEWSFHKSIDLIKSGVLPDYWDGIMQKIAFTIFEIAKQSITQGVNQDEVLRIVEHHVKKTYRKALVELKDRKIIDKVVLERALRQSNIDDMMHQIQEEKVEQEIIQESQNAGSNQSNSKILKLATVAILLKQIPQNKVQSILKKFDPNDVHTINQYMQMKDLESKLDKNITIKCLYEIQKNLPEPKYISPEKILSRMKNVFEKVPKENIDRIILKERTRVKDFVVKAREGEYSQLPTKVANIIAQHLEESIS